MNTSFVFWRALLALVLLTIAGPRSTCASTMDVVGTGAAMEVVQQFNASLPASSGSRPLLQMVGAALHRNSLWVAGVRSHDGDPPLSQPNDALARHSEGHVVQFNLTSSSEGWQPVAAWTAPGAWFHAQKTQFIPGIGTVVLEEASTEYNAIVGFHQAPAGHPLARGGSATVAPGDGGSGAASGGTPGNQHAVVCTASAIILLDLDTLTTVLSSAPALNLTLEPKTPGLVACAVDWPGSRVYTVDRDAGQASVYELQLDTMAVLRGPVPMGLTVSGVLSRYQLAVAGDWLVFLDGKSVDVKVAPTASLQWNATAPFDGLLNAMVIAGSPWSPRMLLTLEFGFVVQSLTQFATGSDKDIGYNDDPLEPVSNSGCTALAVSDTGQLLFQYCPRRFTRMDTQSLAPLDHATVPDVFGPGANGPRNIALDPATQNAFILGWTETAVVQMTTAKCQMHGSCAQCTADPACGWCFDVQRCTLAAQCVAGSGFHSTDQCADIQVLDPKVGSTAGRTPLRVQLTLPFSPANATCEFRPAGSSLAVAPFAETPATPVPGSLGTLQCVSPARSSTAVGSSSIEVALSYLGFSLTQTPLTFTYYDCSPFVTCALCHDPDARPECGWCLSSGSCGGLGSCPVANERVPVEENGSSGGGGGGGSSSSGSSSLMCPKLSSIDPASVPTDVGDRSVVVSLSHGRVASATGILKCVFGSLPATPAQYVNQTAVSCMAPRASEAGTYPVALVYADSGRSYAANDATFRYNDCGAASDCVSCAEAATAGCGWCLTSGACGHENACANKAYWVPAGTRTGAGVHQCPGVADAVSPTRVAADGGQTIEVTGDGLFFDAPGNWTCGFSGAQVRTPATVASSTALRCVVPAHLPGEASVRPFFGDQPFGDPSSASTIQFVDCAAARDCDACRVLRSDGCGWCATERRCTGRSACGAADSATASAAVWVADRCPDITSISPSFGRVSGGQTITIKGPVFVPGLQCKFGSLPPVDATFNAAQETLECVAPAGDAGANLQFSLILDGMPYATTEQPFGIVEEQLPLPPLAVAGIAGGLVVCLLVAVVAACCFMRKSRQALQQVRAVELKYMPPKLTAALQASVAFVGIDPKAAPGGPKKARNAKDLERLLVDEPVVAAAMTRRATSAEIDGLAKALVILNEAHSSAVRLINFIASAEIAATDQRSALFRTNSVATKMFQMFSKMRGLQYIHATLGSVVNEAAASGAGSGGDDDLGLLVLAQRALSEILSHADRVPIEFQAIFANVRLGITRKFPITVDSLTDVVYETLKAQLLESKQTIDSQIRNYNKIDDIETELSRTLGDGCSVKATKAMEQQYVAPEALKPKVRQLDQFVAALAHNVDDLVDQMQAVAQASTDLQAALDPSSDTARALLDKQANHQLSIAVGGFFFLRFVSPAIMTPESYGLMEQPPSRDQRKPLILLAKLFQNLSNGMALHGSAQMRKLNDLVESSLPAVNEFFRSVSDASPDNESTPCKIPDDIKGWASAYVVDFVSRNVDKVASELLQMGQQTAEQKLRALCDSGGLMTTKMKTGKKRLSGNFSGKSKQ